MNSKLLNGGLVLTLVLVAACACYLWLGRDITVDRRLAESVRRSECVFERYFNAEDGGAKQAMIEHIEYLDKLSSEFGGQNRNPYAFDAMAWCVRLAKLEERNKGTSGSEYIGDRSAGHRKPDRPSILEGT